MARLNMDKAIKQGELLIRDYERYSLSVSHMHTLHNMEEWDKITAAFYFGVCQGGKDHQKGESMNYKDEIIRFLNELDNNSLRWIYKIIRAMIWEDEGVHNELQK